jgi:hypothetical protein
MSEGWEMDSELRLSDYCRSKSSHVIYLVVRFPGASFAVTQPSNNSAEERDRDVLERPSFESDAPGQSAELSPEVSMQPGRIILRGTVTIPVPEREVSRVVNSILWSRGDRQLTARDVVQSMSHIPGVDFFSREVPRMTRDLPRRGPRVASSAQGQHERRQRRRQEARRRQHSQQLELEQQLRPLQALVGRQLRGMPPTAGYRADYGFSLDGYAGGMAPMAGHHSTSFDAPVDGMEEYVYGAGAAAYPAPHGNAARTRSDPRALGDAHAAARWPWASEPGTLGALGGAEMADGAEAEEAAAAGPEWVPGGEHWVHGVGGALGREAEDPSAGADDLGEVRAGARVRVGSGSGAGADAGAAQPGAEPPEAGAPGARGGRRLGAAGESMTGKRKQAENDHSAALCSAAPAEQPHWEVGSAGAAALGGEHGHALSAADGGAGMAARAPGAGPRGWHAPASGSGAARRAMRARAAAGAAPRSATAQAQLAAEPPVAGMEDPGDSGPASGLFGAGAAGAADWAELPGAVAEGEARRAGDDAGAREAAGREALQAAAGEGDEPLCDAGARPGGREPRSGPARVAWAGHETLSWGEEPGEAGGAAAAAAGGGGAAGVAERVGALSLRAGEDAGPPGAGEERGTRVHCGGSEQGAAPGAAPPGAAIAAPCPEALEVVSDYAPAALDGMPAVQVRAEVTGTHQHALSAGAPLVRAAPKNRCCVVM